MCLMYQLNGYCLNYYYCCYWYRVDLEDEKNCCEQSVDDDYNDASDELDD